MSYKKLTFSTRVSVWYKPTKGKGPRQQRQVWIGLLESGDWFADWGLDEEVPIEAVKESLLKRAKKSMEEVRMHQTFIDAADKIHES